MADTLTTHYGWIMPEDQASADTWGQKLNNNLQAIDATVWQTAQAYVGQISPSSISWSNTTAPTGQQVRWTMSLINTESGTNTGSDLALLRFDNTGAPFASGGGLLGTPTVAAGAPLLTVNRATGAASFAVSATFVQGLTLGVAAPLNLNGSLVQFNSADGATKYGSIGGAAGAINLVPAGGTAVDLTVGNNGTFNGLVSNGSLYLAGGQNGVYFAYGATLAASMSFKVDNPSSGSAAGALTISNQGQTLVMDSGRNWTVSNTINCTFNGSGNFTANNPGGAFKPGGGSWSAISDERVKTVERGYDLGLDKVTKLRPVVYRYKGNDGDQHDASKQHVGLIAQEVERIMPGMVTQRAGTIDGRTVTDMRQLDTTELLFALVNCVRELSARIEKLEAQRPERRR